VVASVTYYEPDEQLGCSASRNMGVAQTVTCLPYIEPQPPLEPAHHPGEFVLKTKQAARTFFFGRKLGDISFATMEPQPLTYDGEQLSATELTLRISFDSNLADFDIARNSTVKVEPVLQVQSFYASTRMISNPVKSSVQEGGPLRIDTDFVRLDQHIASSLQWEPTDICTEPENGISILRAATGGTQSLPQRNEPLHQEDRSSSTGVAGKVTSWVSFLKVPIKPPFRLYPSFRSSYVGISYTIIAKISISDVYHKSAYLAVPLQVAYPCSAGCSSEELGVLWQSGSTPPTTPPNTLNVGCTSAIPSVDPVNVSHQYTRCLLRMLANIGAACSASV
jgi:hypothetical protein